MKFSKIAKALELRHYKKLLLFMFRHPILFVERLSMFIKISIAWTVVSTLFGFFLFGLVTRELIIEKNKNAKLTEDSKIVEKRLADFENSSTYKEGTGTEAELRQSVKILNDSILVYERMAVLPFSHKKLPDFRNRLQTVLTLLLGKNNTKALAELEKLSEDVTKEVNIQSL